ncbi:MAG: hypothetical protein HOY79_43965 [Streptomyces sp.]|nr:hypothetical protein [Streptomyces sp.]
MALIAVAVTGVVGVGAGVAAAGAGSGAVPTAAAAAPLVAQAVPEVQAAQGGDRPAAAAAVADGQVDVGGYKLSLAADGLHVLSPGAAKAEVLRVAEVLPNKVSTLASSDGSGTLLAGIYRGPVSGSTKITIMLDGRKLPATVTSLPGNPGWGVFYVLDSHNIGAAKPSITVQNF